MLPPDATLVVLRNDRTTRCDDDFLRDPLQAALAMDLEDDSPADGTPGLRFLRELAEATGGVLSIAPPAPGKEGEVE